MFDISKYHMRILTCEVTSAAGLDNCIPGLTLYHVTLINHSGRVSGGSCSGMDYRPWKAFLPRGRCRHDRIVPEVLVHQEILIHPVSCPNSRRKASCLPTGDLFPARTHREPRTLDARYPAVFGCPAGTTNAFDSM
ncbi:hypothetical protein RRG08_020669 [Elysia crispata]|uniref:Uncharacterized protein n=1 Tax=Elysia crispata TaxID=231223 RepID=A0AAE0Z4J3_9GAST|nr:hypothetical protein RRG08_020669 [Elysia crispata]